MKSKFLLLVVILLSLLCSCYHFSEVPEDKFLGIWELKGRSMFDGVQIKIEKHEGLLRATIVRLNDNKWVKMFASVDDVWISEIKRSSNFEFKITEKKLGKDLFSLYGMSTSQDFEAEFIDDNTVGLATGASSPTNSSIVYKRIR